MKKMIIFDPAMCCSTGVCGPSVNVELLRVATLINNLKKRGILIERYNLTSNPQAFVDNKKVNEMLDKEGTDVLPITMVDGEIVKTKDYPTNEEFYKLLGIKGEISKDKVIIRKPKGGCGCNGGFCCK